MEDSTRHIFVEDEVWVTEKVYSMKSRDVHADETSPTEDDVVHCGDVFFVRDEYFALVCAQCNAAFHNLCDFGDHIICKHMDVKSIRQKPTPTTNTPSKVDNSDTIASDECTEKTVESLKNSDDRKDEDSQVKDVPKNDPGPPYRCPPLVDPALFCELCNQRFSNKHSIDAHNEIKHNKPRPCEFCLKSFQNTSDLIEHKKTHTGDDARFQCPKCPKTFTSKYYRNAHFQAVHKGVKRFQCPHCPMSFCMSTGLSVHLPTHSVSGDYACEVCNRQFAYKSELNTHMRVHTGEKPFMCEICGKSYSLQHRLTQHKKRHFNQRDYVCNICGKRFFSNALLKNHAIGHSSERPYKCKECGRSFTRVKSLRTHLLLHDPEKKFVCVVCEKSFAQRPGLLSHMKLHLVNVDDN